MRHAGECVRLAGLTDDLTVRDQLLDLALDWIFAAQQGYRRSNDARVVPIAQEPRTTTTTRDELNQQTKPHRRKPELPWRELAVLRWWSEITQSDGWRGTRAGKVRAMGRSGVTHCERSRLVEARAKAHREAHLIERSPTCDASSSFICSRSRSVTNRRSQEFSSWSSAIRVCGV